MVACTVNSYTRLIPGFWAPTDSRLGRGKPHDGACASSRARKSRSGSSTGSRRRTSTRISRSPPPSAPGLWGIENKIEPGDPIQGNAYAVEHPKERALPRSLGEAAERLKASKPARALFGDTFVDHYAATREWEEREARKAITDWQLARYFEIILKHHHG